jgi:TonB family protein
MRFLPSLLGALLITVAVFLFMQSLIQSRREAVVPVPVFEDVQVLREEPEREQPDREPEVPDRAPPEPSTDALAVGQVAPSAPAEVQAAFEMPAFDFAVGDITVQATGSRWSAPLAADAIATVPGGGSDGRGYIEVIPFNTRQPNVPEVAWQNRISGWVLVAFNVTPDGKTRNIRVLDAKPRGVFEEKVIAAVEDWTYRVNFSGKAAAGNIVLTQKIEVLWENYPQNMPNVD